MICSSSPALAGQIVACVLYATSAQLAEPDASTRLPCSSNKGRKRPDRCFRLRLPNKLSRIPKSLLGCIPAQPHDDRVKLPLASFPRDFLPFLQIDAHLDTKVRLILVSGTSVVLADKARGYANTPQPSPAHET